MRGAILPIVISVIVHTVCNSQQTGAGNVSTIQDSEIANAGREAHLREPVTEFSHTLPNGGFQHASESDLTTQQTRAFEIRKTTESQIDTRLAGFPTNTHTFRSTESDTKRASNTTRHLREHLGLNILHPKIQGGLPIQVYGFQSPSELEQVAPGLRIDDWGYELPAWTSTEQSGHIFRDAALPATENEIFLNMTRAVLCGYPPYSDRAACRKLDYSVDPLSECEVAWRRDIFAIMIALLGAVIICVNSLIPVVVVKNSDMRTHYDLIKVSLAVADIIVGFLMFTSVIPSILWARNLTEAEIVKLSAEKANCPTAVIAGSFLTISMQASLLHLCFLSFERFMAIKWSFWRMRRRTRSIVITLIGIWIASIIAAVIPALLPQHFEYKFQPALLIYMLTMSPSADGGSVLGRGGLLYTFATLVLPYTIMVSVCIATGIVSYRKLKSRARCLGRECAGVIQTHAADAKSKNVATHWASPVRKKQNKDRAIHPEIAVFITILIMIGAFTFTLLPFGIVVALFMSEVLNCDNYTLPYVAALYFALLNSLVNGIIYSVRDPKFRQAVKRLFRKEAAQDQRLVIPRSVPILAHDSPAKANDRK